MENMENTDNINQMIWNTVFFIQNTVFVTQTSLFVNQMTQNILFYGIHGSNSHNVRTWRTWSWVADHLRMVELQAECWALV